jgi:hypothetical protein
MNERIDIQFKKGGRALRMGRGKMMGVDHRSIDRSTYFTVISQMSAPVVACVK